jgi:hypothetical protein
LPLIYPVLPSPQRILPWAMLATVQPQKYCQVSRTLTVLFVKNRMLCLSGLTGQLQFTQRVNTRDSPAAIYPRRLLLGIPTLKLTDKHVFPSRLNLCLINIWWGGLTDIGSIYSLVCW